LGYQSPCFPPMAVARHPVARTTPPAPAIISASRARVGERYGTRGNFLLILQCAGRHHRFGARARQSAVSGHHPRTTRMSLGGGECRVGRAAAPWDHHRRRGAESSRHPIGTNKPSTSAAVDRPLPHASAAQAAGAGRAPRRSISHARRCPRARRPLSERCHKSPPHRIVETLWLSRATP